MARVGVLVIRIWVADGGLRARLTQVDDVAMDGLSVAVVASAEELTEAVLRWVGRLHEETSSRALELGDTDLTPPSRKRDGD